MPVPTSFNDVVAEKEPKHRSLMALITVITSLTGITRVGFGINENFGLPILGIWKTRELSSELEALIITPKCI